MFNMSFSDAVNLLFSGNGKWIQGENFSEDSYLSLEEGVVTLNTIHESFSYPWYSNNVPLTEGLMKQNYREIIVLNKNSLKIKTKEE